MEESLLSAIHWLLAVLALPSVGLSAIFTVSLVSATLLPLGSEPAVFGYIKLAPDMFWPAVLVATLGNTIGGAISYAMGLAAERAVQRWKENTPIPTSPIPMPGRTAACAAAGTSARTPGCTAWVRRRCCCPGCRSWATRCAPWPGGCGCHSALRGLHGHRQVPALRGDDGRPVVVLPGQL